MFLVFFLIPFLLFSDVFEKGIESLNHDFQGYTVVSNVFENSEIQKFAQIDIQKKEYFLYSGNASSKIDGLEEFFLKIGNNSKDLSAWATEKIHTLMKRILQASKREVACFLVQSFIPSSDYDIPRWHTDGLYFRAPFDYLAYKFVITLKGPSTLFHPADPVLRKIVQEHCYDREYLSKICTSPEIFSPNTGEGAFLIGSNWKHNVAIHSEPPIHEERLFFSAIPCNQEQLVELTQKMVTIYRSLSRTK